MSCAPVTTTVEHAAPGSSQSQAKVRVESHAGAGGETSEQGVRRRSRPTCNPMLVINTSNRILLGNVSNKTC